VSAAIARVSLFSLLSMLLPPPSSTLFPYTTLFRSWATNPPLCLVAKPKSTHCLFLLAALGHRQASTAALVQPLSSLQQNRQRPRSEEHTSELQSRFDLVCRLLLEKKNKRIITTNNI